MKSFGARPTTASPNFCNTSAQPLAQNSPLLGYSLATALSAFTPLLHHFYPTVPSTAFSGGSHLHHNHSAHKSAQTPPPSRNLGPRVAGDTLHPKGLLAGDTR